MYKFKLIYKILHFIEAAAGNDQLRHRLGLSPQK